MKHETNFTKHWREFTRRSCYIIVILIGLILIVNNFYEFWFSFFLRPVIGGIFLSFITLFKTGNYLFILIAIHLSLPSYYLQYYLWLSSAIYKEEKHIVCNFIASSFCLIGTSIIFWWLFLIPLICNIVLNYFTSEICTYLPEVSLYIIFVLASLTFIEIRIQLINMVWILAYFNVFNNFNKIQKCKYWVVVRCLLLILSNPYKQLIFSFWVYIIINFSLSNLKFIDSLDK